MPRALIDKRLDPPIPALHPERDALLAAVRDADERDDLPALVYADWQDEHDQPEHAEFIRVMCELDRSRTRDKKARRSALLARMKELFKAPPLKPLRELESNTWSFERGFVRDLTIEVFPNLPGGPVRNRRMCGPPGRLDLPAYVPFDKVAWLGLMLPDDPTADVVAALAAQPWFRRVDRLESQRWEAGHIGPGVLRPLAKSPHAASLRMFEMHSGTIAGDELVALYTAASMTGLRVLDLSGLDERVTAAKSRRATRAAFVDAVGRIGSSPRARRLISLGEKPVWLGEATARVLLASRHLVGVRTLFYVNDGLSARTKARVAERFGPAAG